MWWHILVGVLAGLLLLYPALLALLWRAYRHDPDADGHRAASAA